MEKRSGGNHFVREGQEEEHRIQNWLHLSRQKQLYVVRVQRDASRRKQKCQRRLQNKDGELTTGHVSQLTVRTTGRFGWSRNHREKHQLETTPADPSSRNTALMFRAESCCCSIDGGTVDEQLLSSLCNGITANRFFKNLFRVYFLRNVKYKNVFYISHFCTCIGQ